jgi:hypothetical protein
MKFFQLNTLGDSNDDSLCCIEDYVKGLEMSDSDTKRGRSVAETWPADAAIHLRKSSGRKLTDVLSTIKNNLFVSARVRDVIAKHCAGIAVEYLPFQLFDHRKRLLSRDYVIVNPLGSLDCLDLKASNILWDEDDPNEALRVKKPVFSAKKLAEAPALFRIRQDETFYIINRPLALDLYAGDFSNLFWTEVEVR